MDTPHPSVTLGRVSGGRNDRKDGEHRSGRLGDGPAGVRPAGIRPAITPASARTVAKTANAATHPKVARKDSFDVSGTLAASPAPQNLAIQADLIWLGGFDELSADEIVKRMPDAIKAFQRRNSGKDTGVLSAPGARRARASRAGAKAAVGCGSIDDTATGTPERAGEAGAARCRRTERQPLDFAAVNSRSKRSACTKCRCRLCRAGKTTAKRYAGSSVLNANSFVITGEQKLKKSSSARVERQQECAAFTILYDQATEGTMAPIAVAIAIRLQASGPNAPPPRDETGRRYGSVAIVVSARGDLVALGELTDNCRSITVPGFGHAERVAGTRPTTRAVAALWRARSGAGAAPGATTAPAHPSH